MWLQALNLKNKQKQQYYMQLEDDLKIDNNYLEIIDSKIKEISKQNDNLWQMMEFVKTGFIGRLFKSNLLHELMISALIQYRTLPCDWILDTFLDQKYCPKKGKLECEKILQKFVPYVDALIFTHEGKYSSSDGQVRKIGNLLPQNTKKPKFGVPGRPVSKMTVFEKGEVKKKLFENQNLI